MPEQHSYPDLTAPTDPLSLVRELRKRRKNISEADLDVLERLLAEAAPVKKSRDETGRYIAAAQAVPLTADLFTAAGQGQADMQSRVVEALTKLG